MAPGIFSILVMAIAQNRIFIKGARANLVKQARAELAVTEIEYNLKLDLMGGSVQDRTEKPIIIAAAKNDAVGSSELPANREKLKQVLYQETLELDIEYATLVDSDLGMIANANADRTGEVFDSVSVFNLFLATVLGRYITQPLKSFQSATQAFAAGDRWSRASAFAKDEVGQLALAFNQLADSVVRSEARLREQAQQQQNESKKLACC